MKKDFDPSQMENLKKYIFNSWFLKRQTVSIEPHSKHGNSS